MEDVPEIEPGYWLSRWTDSADAKEVTFNFEPGAAHVFYGRGGGASRSR